MIITHRCPSCGDFATAPGTCGFCDLELRALELAAADPQTGCPDWPDEERDQRDRRSGRRQPAPRPRTRTAA